MSAKQLLTEGLDENIQCMSSDGVLNDISIVAAINAGLETTHWIKAHPDVKKEFAKLLTTAAQHGRKLEHHVIPIGSPDSPCISLSNYAPMASTQVRYGTAAEAVNSSMTAVRTKLRMPPTIEAMTEYIFWIENFFERQVVPKRKGGSRTTPYLTLPSELRNTHTRFWDSRWDRSRASVATGVVTVLSLISHRIRIMFH
jgi:hypothetical protein